LRLHVKIFKQSIPFGYLRRHSRVNYGSVSLIGLKSVAFCRGAPL
jgi:hypothetical protein